MKLWRFALLALFFVRIFFSSIESDLRSRYILASQLTIMCYISFEAYGIACHFICLHSLVVCRFKWMNTWKMSAPNRRCYQVFLTLYLWNISFLRNHTSQTTTPNTVAFISIAVDLLNCRLGNDGSRSIVATGLVDWWQEERTLAILQGNSVRS